MKEFATDTKHGGGSDDKEEVEFNHNVDNNYIDNNSNDNEYEYESFLPKSKQVVNNNSVTSHQQKQHQQQQQQQYLPSRTGKFWLILLVLVVTVVAQGMISYLYYFHFATTTTTTTTKNNNTYGYIKSNKIYGHLHFPKTGGSNLDGMMAATYDNVCGNKGYSYDSYQFNARGAKDGITRTGGNVDSTNVIGKKGDRGKVDKDVMDEIGYEDCEYISVERKWKFWPQLTTTLLNFTKYNMTLELHVPCRDPLEHLMSMANHLGIKYRCDDEVFETTGDDNSSNIEKSVHSAYMDRLGDKRFSNELLWNQKTNHHIELKCFTPFPLQSYVEYMSPFLPHRRFTVPHYVKRETNKPRHREKECIWKTSPEYQQKVHQLLMEKHPYMKFCHDCMGSTNELQLHS